MLRSNLWWLDYDAAVKRAVELGIQPPLAELAVREAPRSGLGFHVSGIRVSFVEGYGYAVQRIT